MIYDCTNEKKIKSVWLDKIAPITSTSSRGHGIQGRRRELNNEYKEGLGNKVSYS